MHIEPGSQSIRLRDGRINKKTLAILQCSTKTYAKLESKTDCIISHKKCQSSYHSIPSPSGELKTIHEQINPHKNGLSLGFSFLDFKRHLKTKPQPTSSHTSWGFWGFSHTEARCAPSRGSSRGMEFCAMKMRVVSESPRNSSKDTSSAPAELIFFSKLVTSFKRCWCWCLMGRQESPGPHVHP